MLYRLAPLLGLLLGLLSSCTVYDQVFHPHRLGNPPMTASAKAKAKAAEKARHKGTTLAALSADENKTGDAASGGDAASAATAAPDDAKALSDKNKAIEDMLGNTYNTKTGLLKRTAIQRFQNNNRKLHHYNLSAPPHTEATRDARHLRKHPKGTGAPKGEKETGSRAREAASEDDAPGFTPDPTQPAAPKAKAPQALKAPAPKPAKAPTPKPTKPAAAQPKAKADKAAEAAAKEQKLRNGGEQSEKTRSEKEKPLKVKKDKNAPKPDPTQPPADHN